MKTAVTKTKLSVITLISIFMLSACGGGSSDSGSGETEAGSSIPEAFIGVYNGTINLRASAAGLTARESYPITITVTADGQLRFDGDEPNETATVGVTNDGRFSGQIPVDEEDCSGTVTFSGQINAAGTNASGDLEGEGRCTVSGTTLDVDLSGDFSANK